MRKHAKDKFSYLWAPEIKQGDLYFNREFRFTNTFPFINRFYIVYRFTGNYWIENAK